MKTQKIQSRVMKRAWELYLSQDIRTMSKWSLSLKKAWYEIKNPVINFDVIYNEYYEKILRYFLIKSNVRVLSEDLTSETFIKVFRNLDMYNSKYAVSTWVYNIAKNVFIDYLRSKKHNTLDREIKIGGYIYDNGNEIFDLVSNEYDLIEKDELNNQILVAFKSLTPIQSKVSRLALVDGYKMKEIAEMCDISLSNVKVIINRSRVVLRKNLEQVRTMY